MDREASGTEGIRNIKPYLCYDMLSVIETGSPVYQKVDFIENYTFFFTASKRKASINTSTSQAVVLERPMKWQECISW